MMISNIITITLVHFLANLFAPPASNAAYLDPGSGSIIIQVVMAVLLGGALILKMYWKKITSFFNKTKDEDDEDKEV
jgi:hypothetical protein